MSSRFGRVASGGSRFDNEGKSEDSRPDDDGDKKASRFDRRGGSREGSPDTRRSSRFEGESGDRRPPRNNDEDGGEGSQRPRRRSGSPSKGGDDEQRAPVTYIPPEMAGRDELRSGHTTAGINFKKYSSVPVKVSGADLAPISSFREARLEPLVMDAIEYMGYKDPTPIQKYCIPAILQKRDVMACAQTGSGKTAGYLLPIINNMLKDGVKPAGGGEGAPQCLVLCPTRELAAQVDKEAAIYTYGTGYKTMAVYGQVDARYTSNKLRAGVNIVSATTGRLKDVLQRGTISLKNLEYLVLDEADRMLDMGFRYDIEAIVKHAPKDRVSLMFSATFPGEIQNLAKEHLHEYLFITTGIVGGACADVSQKIVKCDGRMEKKEALEKIIADSKDRDGKCGKILVFCETKEETDKIGLELACNGVSSTTIHGNRTQEQRETALADFKGGRKAVLVATNVAARGLDIPNVEHVVNWDLPRGPQDMDEYVHRIGRTGRVGNQGTAHTLYSSRNSAVAPKLVEILSQSGQPVPDWLYEEAGMSVPENAVSAPVAGERFGALDTRGTDFRVPPREETGRSRFDRGDADVDRREYAKDPNTDKKVEHVPCRWEHSENDSRKVPAIASQKSENTSGNESRPRGDDDNGRGRRGDDRRDDRDVPSSRDQESNGVGGSRFARGDGGSSDAGSRSERGGGDSSAAASSRFDRREEATSKACDGGDDNWTTPVDEPAATVRGGGRFGRSRFGN